MTSQERGLWQISSSVDTDATLAIITQNLVFCQKPWCIWLGTKSRKSVCLAKTDISWSPLFTLTAINWICTCILFLPSPAYIMIDNYTCSVLHFVLVILAGRSVATMNTSPPSSSISHDMQLASALKNTFRMRCKNAATFRSLCSLTDRDDISTYLHLQPHTSQRGDRSCS